MSGNEIREKIDANNLIIRSKLDNFVLTDEIKNLLAENETLRNECPHEFIDGICIYCDGFEEDLI